MSNENLSWENVTSNYETTEEQFFNEWAFFEQKFGEFGTPGFSERTLPARFPSIFGHNDSVNVRFTLYRAEDGQLLFVHGCYIDENDNNLQKPFVWNAHPDHQRQGLGTMMANHIKARYEQENNQDFTYEQSLRNTAYNTAGANFANKYVNNVYEQKNN